MPKNTVYVGRGSKWGNPFKVTAEMNAHFAVTAFEVWLKPDGRPVPMSEKKEALLSSLHELKGKNLACWCKLSMPCHADVLLKLANEGNEAVQLMPCRKQGGKMS